MLTTKYRFLHPRTLEADLGSKLRSLADDIDRLRTGDAPSVEDLAEAPLIVDWHCAISPVGLRLLGFVSGHPRIGNADAMTTQVWAAGEDGTWIRTLSRFYRLGPRFHADTHADTASADDASDFEGGV